MSASPLTRRALAAALAVAAEQGLSCDEPEVLRDASNLLVLLRPAPVVARITTVTSTVRNGDAWLAREVAIASHLAAAGAPVVAPSPELEPGPHHEDGLVLSFWTYVDEGDRPLDAREAGRRLLLCHDALTSFDAADLERLAVIDEADRVLESLAAAGTLDEQDAALLRRAGADVRARMEALALPMQAIHGDAPAQRHQRTRRTAVERLGGLLLWPPRVGPRLPARDGRGLRARPGAGRGLRARPGAGRGRASRLRAGAGREHARRLPRRAPLPGHGVEHGHGSRAA